MSKINPLAQFIDVKAKDILNLEQVLKLNIKKEYKNFCRIHHPDKKKNTNGGVELFIIKQYGEVILRCTEDDYDVVWVFMGYSAMLFEELNLDEIKVTEIVEIIHGITILEDLARDCTHMG